MFNDSLDRGALPQNPEASLTLLLRSHLSLNEGSWENIEGWIVSLINGQLDPLQFAYQPGKGVEDVKILYLRQVIQAPWKSAHARLLFADFSSAFNKMQPDNLIECLASYFDPPDHISLLLLNCLTDIIQWVFVNGQISTSITSNTGSPQGCVLSPLLFIMYTESRRPSQVSQVCYKIIGAQLTDLSSIWKTRYPECQKGH